MAFEHAIKFLGGLGIFFYGMKLLSDSLQSMAGDLIRKIIRALTKNPVMGFFVGTAVTIIVQSSSVTSVMVIGFVNAELMTLAQAIGIIFGANVGTTITGWIIAIKVGKYGLLLIGLGIFPLLFSKRDAIKNIGMLLMALGFVFFGLQLMSSGVKPLRSSEQVLALLEYFTADTFTSLVGCIAIGALVTGIIQSSSAFLGISIALAMTGTVTFQTAIALILGSNIGTTVTAILASIGGNAEAKRTSKAHALFNIVGVLVILPFFWMYINLIESIFSGPADFINSEGNRPYVAAHIAGAHTIFNVIVSILFLPFTKQVAAFVTWINPKPKTKETPHLSHISSVTNMAPSMALIAAEKELENLSNLVSTLLAMTENFVSAIKVDKTKLKAIDRYEDITDSIQTEITVFIGGVQQASLSAAQSKLAGALVRAADELESIGDYCQSIARQKSRLVKEKESFGKRAVAEIEELFQATIAYYKVINDSITNEVDWNIVSIHKNSDKLKKIANKIKNSHQQRLDKGKCSPKAGILFSDIIVGLRKIRGHSLNVAQAMTGHSVGEDF